jgi:uncharacterized protein (DUF2141 family)
MFCVLVQLNNLCLHHLMRATIQYLFITIAVSIFVISIPGCANIVPPTGGPRDSLPPMLISSTPPDSSRNVKPNRIVLTFNEYIDQLQDVGNVIVSPTLPNSPVISSRLRSVTVRFTDTLEPNTTYSINFGKSIRDVNEGNVLEDFTYIFSTGRTIDANTLSGKVLLAQTGKADSTLIAVLHQNLADSAIIKQRPRYYTRLDSSGNFTFYNLPTGEFAVYVLENSYSKRYDDSTKLFAFLNNPVTVSANTPPVALYAYREAKAKPTTATGSTPTNTRNQERRLRYTNAEGNSSKDVLSPLHLDFNRKLKKFDSVKFILSDTNFNPVKNFRVILDSNTTRVTIQHAWNLNTIYKLIIQKDAVADAEGVTLVKSDTLNITTKDAEDYGQVRLRFNNIDMTKNPVLQIVQNDVVIETVPLTGREWRKNLFKPGEYELRILFDVNRNGIWDTGNFKLKRQPEIVQSLPRKLTIRANWENEVDINL